MKKFVWLLILGLLVVPAYAAITVKIDASGTLKFSSRLYPTPVTFVPSANLTFNFDLSGDSKTVGNVVAVINGLADQISGGTPTTSGSITFKNIGGLLDVSLNRGTLTVSGTRIITPEPIKSADGIGLVVNTPFKVTAGYKPDSSDALTFTKGVLAARVDGSVGPASVYALVVFDQGTTNFALGGSVTPVSMVTAFAEYASVSYTWIVGATVKPVTGLELYGEYKGNNDYLVSATLTTIPNVTVKGEYSYKASEQKGTFYAWVKLTQSLPVGSLTVWSGYRTSDNKFAGYARLSTPVGPATNVLLAHYNTGGANDGFMSTPNDQFTLENTLSVSF